MSDTTKKQPSQKDEARVGHAPHPVQTREGMTPKHLMAVLALMAAAFVVAYNFAAAGNEASAVASPTGLAGQAAAAFTGGGGGGGGGCCGGGGAPVEAATTVEGDVQKIDIDTSQGSFNPNVVKAKAGVPIEMTFSQAPGGCLSGVFFPDFNINEDLTGGAKTISLPALDKGEYSFYCQMQMVSAKIVVE